MTLSQFIERYANNAYLQYCEQHRITPELDVELKAPKLCALVKPKLDPKARKQYN